VAAKPLAASTIAKLREELVRKQVELEKLKKQKGLFSGGKIRSTEERIRALTKDINRWEKIMTYELPKLLS
jgi:capsule polysaccharide export protein KpsE/RkpR